MWAGKERPSAYSEFCYLTLVPLKVSLPYEHLGNTRNFDNMEKNISINKNKRTNSDLDNYHCLDKNKPEDMMPLKSIRNSECKDERTVHDFEYQNVHPMV